MPAGKGMRAVALLLLVAVGASGCTYNPRPDPVALDPEVTSGLHAPQGVALINAQTSDATVQIGDAGLGRKVDANYREWTQAAIDLLKKAFGAAGIATPDGAPKSIRMSVDHASQTTGGWGFRCIVSMRAELGNGYGGTYEGSRAGALLTTVCDKSITDAVANMLGDGAVRQYLSE